MRSKALLLTGALLLLAFFTSFSNGGDVLRLRDGAVISFDRMIREIGAADIVFVGEVHNEPAHHDLQLRIIRSLHEAGAPLFVGLEMFRSDSQQDLDSWVGGSSSLEQFLSSYDDNWRHPWPVYSAIFLFAREHQIPLVGLNIPGDITRTVARGGFIALSEEQKKRLPPGISCDIDATYLNFIKKAYAGHGGRQDASFQNFCEAQMVWDKSMAWRLTEHLRTHPGKPAIVLSGIGHAWKRGIPEQVARRESFTYKVVLPMIPGQIERDVVSIDDADYVMLR